jgi:hypothetical protein
MGEERDERRAPNASWRAKMELTSILTICALALSALSFYRSYFYVNQQLDVTVTEVSYVTNQGELYMTVAFSNGGNRDGALLRVEPALWGRQPNKPNAEWIPLVGNVHANIPVTVPKMPTVVKAGGVELVTLSATLDRAAAAEGAAATQGKAFVGIRVATMNADGNLFLLQHAVARLLIDRQGRIHGAEPAIHRSLSGFVDLAGAPPGDMLESNKKTPFVWADEDSAR